MGYEIDVPMSTFYNLPATGERVTLFTHLVVREDAHLLYGFASEAERQAFRQLLKISGVGARTALVAALGHERRRPGRRRWPRRKPGGSTKVPGIGKKTAERLLLELKDKLGAELAGAAAEPRRAGVQRRAQCAALARIQRERGVEAVKQLPGDSPVADGIRQALKLLAKG